MPIAIRAKQALNRRQLLVRSAATVPSPVSAARQTLSQPRRGSSADHLRHSIRRRLGRLRGDLGARRPAGADAGRVFDRREFQDHHPLGLRRCVAGQRFHLEGAARRPAGGAGHFLSRAVRDIDESGIAGETQVGHFRTAPVATEFGFVRLVGRYRGAGLGHRPRPRRYADLPDHARQPSGLLHPFRRSHLCGLPGGVGTEAARRRDLAKHRHRRKIRRRAQPRAVPRQLQIQLARRELSRLPCRRADVRAVGRSRGDQRLGADRHRRRDRLCRGRQLATGGAGAPRVPRIHADARAARAGRPDLSQDRLRPAARRLHARHAQLPRFHLEQARRPKRHLHPRCRATGLAEARTGGLERDLEGDRRRHADRADQRGRALRSATARRSGASTRSPICCRS